MCYVSHAEQERVMCYVLCVTLAMRSRNVLRFAFYVKHSGNALFLSEAVFLPDVVLWRCNRRNAIMPAAW